MLLHSMMWACQKRVGFAVIWSVMQGYIAPSSSDSGCTGSFIYNFFWGESIV